MMTRREQIARALLDRRGFTFYDNPMEGGQDAYDITQEALADADAIMTALRKAGFAVVQREKMRKLASMTIPAMVRAFDL